MTDINKVKSGPAAKSQPEKQCHARLATLKVLRETVIAANMQPVPCNVTLRRMFDDAGIPRYKANATCRRGGGIVYFSVAAVEKWLRHSVLSVKLSAPVAVEQERAA